MSNVPILYCKLKETESDAEENNELKRRQGIGFSAAAKFKKAKKAHQRSHCLKPKFQNLDKMFKGQKKKIPHQNK